MVECDLELQLVRRLGASQLRTPFMGAAVTTWNMTWNMDMLRKLKGCLLLRFGVGGQAELREPGAIAAACCCHRGDTPGTHVHSLEQGP